MGHAVDKSERAPASAAGTDDLEHFRRLVQLQGEIVDLARRNNEAEKHYHSLRKDLEAAFQRRSRGRLHRLLDGVIARIRQLRLIDETRRLDGSRSGRTRAQAESRIIIHKP